MLDLYMLETCPFCKKVIKFLEENGIEYNKIDVSNSENHRRLLETGGKDQVPFISDEGTRLYESDDIINYLKNNRHIKK